jgi:hypothetical protein
MCYDWCTSLLNYITRGKYCQSRIYAGGSQPKRNVASTFLVLVLQCIYGFFSLNNSCLREYFNPMFVLELELKDSTNTTTSASYLELHNQRNLQSGPFEIETIWLKRWFLRICLRTFLMLIWSHVFIVFSTHFICCSYLYSNQITSIQSGTFSDLPKIYYQVSSSLLHYRCLWFWFTKYVV